MELAVELCCANVGSRGFGKVLLENAVARICAEDVVAEVDMPGFERSLVDGYALREDDLGKGITSLQVAAVIPAGCGDEIILRPGQCARIMTGAPIPAGVAAVIKQEEVCKKDGLIFLTRKVKKGENIQSADSIYKKGHIIVSRGAELNAQNIEALAATGMVEIPVYHLPEIYLINTGSETIMPGGNLENGQIFQSNHSLLAAKAISRGCARPKGNGVTEDDISLIKKEIERGLESADLVIITGGTSYGDYDLVLPALEQNEIELLFTSIALRPGRNVTAGVKEGKLIINLPGHPGAVDILFDAIVLPVLRKMKGLSRYGNKWANIKLSQTIEKRIAQRTLMRAELIENQAEFFARPLGKDGSFNGIKPMLVDIKPGQGEKGDTVKGLILD